MSRRTLLVMPMLVAASASPTNSAAIGSLPSMDASPKPARIGRIIAMTAVRIAGFPTANRSSVRTSRPTVNSRTTTPISAKTARRLTGCHEAERVRPDDEPAEQLPDDSRLSQAPHELLAQLRTEQQDEQPEQDAQRLLTGTRGRGERTVLRRLEQCSERRPRGQAQCDSAEHRADRDGAAEAEVMAVEGHWR